MKKYNGMGGIIEQLVCIAIGAVVLLIMVKGCIAVYGLFSELLQQMQQTDIEQIKEFDILLK